MSSSNFYKLWRLKRQTIAIIVILALIIVTIATLLQTFKYESRSKMLVVEDFPAGTDAYTISKSNEYLSTLLAMVIKTDSFYQKVIDSGFNIDKSYFTSFNNFGSKNKILKKWGKTVEAKPINDSGIIEIKVFHPSKYQAEQINKAIDYVLKTDHQQYHGGENIVLREIEAPLSSLKPVKPNVAVNLAFGFVFGLSLALIYVYLFPEEEYNLRLWPRAKAKKTNLSQNPQVQSTVDYYNQVSDNHKQFLKNQVQEDNFSPSAQQPNQPAFRKRPPEPVAVSAAKQNSVEDNDDIDDGFADNSLSTNHSFQAELNGSMDNILG